jgi:hypothetical protein
MTRTQVMIAACLLAVSSACATDDFESALEKAHSNEVTDAGRAYERPLFEKLGPALQRAMQHCFSPSNPAAGTQFSVVMAVQENGAITRPMVQPESLSTLCVVHQIESVRVASPPSPNWWIVIDMTITP